MREIRPTFETCLVCMLMLGSLGLSFALYRCKISDKQNNNTSSMYSKLLIHNSIESLKYSNVQIDDFEVMDSGGDVSNFSEHLSDKSTVVLKYSSHNCITCIDAELENLMKLADLKGVDRVVILVVNSNFRELRAVLNARGMYNVKALLMLDNESDQFYTASPMLFLTNDKLELSLPFIPIKELPLYSEKYYELIESVI